ncbi:hypothetical protein D9758_007102 [Tetrapyrgos nigripes]|uniref:Hydrophobin n=1 Tax=Tetrapyrgos nigripes TaxID=182062 RepID=A0A8H5GD89_9AGAR|nr:hypothetical protein D9758_007102 [Tetrapyrgos nigripes]
MRFTRLASIAALATLAVATPTLDRRNKPASQCTTGPIQCCETVETVNLAERIIVLLGITSPILLDPTVLVGLTCTDIDVVGAGGESCSATPACCQDHSFNGIIALGCVPVDLNL